MDYSISDIFLKRCNTITEINIYQDSFITLQSRKYVLKKIKQLDVNFYRSMVERVNTSFTFGDKYFAPVNGRIFICIPKGIKVSDILKYKELAKDKEFLKMVADDFVKMSDNFNGYFEL